MDIVRKVQKDRNFHTVPPQSCYAHKLLILIKDFDELIKLGEEINSEIIKEKSFEI